MSCDKCGAQNDSNNSFCSQCGNNLEELKKQISIANNKKANIICTISFCCSLLAILMFFGTQYGILPMTDAEYEILLLVVIILGLAGLILTLIVASKYPKNRFGKVLRTIYLLILLYYVIAVIISLILLILAFFNGGWID